jgi:lipoic acid synthetase
VLTLIDRPSLEQYGETLSFQRGLANAKIEDESLSDYLILVEHDHVYTVGRGETPEVFTRQEATVRVVETNRGGKTTYHGPGQLVVYPVINLAPLKKDVHWYLRQLETVIIQSLKLFGIAGYAREGFTGVWVKDAEGNERKIASIGVGIKKWITYHGFALNITTDLNRFKSISPCGQDPNVMTSLAAIIGEEKAILSMKSAKEIISGSFIEVFGYELNEAQSNIVSRRRPTWLRAKAPGSPTYLETLEIVKSKNLVTVCEEARCPNMGDCWSHHTATFMIMGELCTRRCSFCSVKDGSLENLPPLDQFEPFKVAQATKELGLKHVVITSVNRDDLSDMGAEHFNQTVKAIYLHNPDCAIELLIPDMRGNLKLVEQILESGLVEILNHNVETVPRLYRKVRPGAVFERSLKILAHAKSCQPEIKTKSGLMVGLGETTLEVYQVMESLRNANVDILTIGQYLQPTAKQLPIERYVRPEEFDKFKEYGLTLGFKHVESGPLVRSSYHAWSHAEGARQASIKNHSAVDEQVDSLLA